MSSGESHDESETNSSAKEALETTPPLVGQGLFGGYPDDRSAHNV